MPPGTDEVEEADLTHASVVVLLIDDNAEDHKIAGRLTSSGLQCRAIGPGGSLDALVSEVEQRADSGEADAVILDYRLDDTDSGGEQFPHRAGTLAAELKEHRPLLPLVLLTTEGKLQQWLFRTPQVHALFDLLVLKPETTTEGGRKRIVVAVDDLTVGFRSLEGYGRGSGWGELGGLLGATAEELEDLADCFPAGPPVGDAEAANWLLRLLLDRPGPLLGLADAAARLGVTQASFRANLSMLQELRYTGPFWRLRPRWWRGRLQRGRSEGVSPATTLVAANCRVCTEESASRACMVCREGIDLRHGVRVHDDASLAWAEPQLVCYDCIAEGRAEHVTFPRGMASLVDELRTGEGNAVRS